MIPLHGNPNRQFVAISSDRDMKCILLEHRHKFKHGCALHYGTGRYVDILAFAELLEADGWTVSAYNNACILCGHDFFFKKWILHQTGCKHIFQGVCAMLASKRSRVDLLDKRDFVLLLRLLYSVKLGETDRVCTMDDIRDIVDGKDKTRLLVPSDDVIDYAFAIFTWSVSYWASLQSTIFKPRLHSVANLVPPADLPEV